MSCFSQEDFQKLLAGELTVEEESKVDQHLSDCLQCREQLAALTEDSPLAARISAGLSSNFELFDNPDSVVGEAVSNAAQVPPTQSLGEATICDHLRPPASGGGHPRWFGKCGTRSGVSPSVEREGAVLVDHRRRR
jgi:anti-sigma factor RsiW